MNWLQDNDQLTFHLWPSRFKLSNSLSFAVGKSCPYTIMFKSQLQSLLVTSETNHGMRLPWKRTWDASPDWMRKSAKRKRDIVSNRIDGGTSDHYHRRNRNKVQSQRCLERSQFDHPGCLWQCPRVLPYGYQECYTFLWITDPRQGRLKFGTYFFTVSAKCSPPVLWRLLIWSSVILMRRDKSVEFPQRQTIRQSSN